MKKFALAVLLVLGACTSATSPLKPVAAKKDITCRSGYHIATREDGTQYCEQDGK